MGNIIIAPVGDNTKALFIGMKRFPTEQVILISPKENLISAKELQEKLKEFTIPAKIIEIKGNVLGEMFRVFAELCKNYPVDDLIVNIATGDRLSTCAALSAAYANGLKAIGVMGSECMLMPIMKLSYYNELSESKLTILKQLHPDKYTSLKEIHEKTKMSIALISYHINGNYKYKGLKEFRLVETKEKSKNLHIKLSEMGVLLLKGYLN